MDGYNNRIIDDMLSERLETMGAVLLEGAKWRGKTTTPHRGTIIRAKKHTVWRGRILFVSFDDDSSSYFVTRIADALRRRLVTEGYLMTPVVATFVLGVLAKGCLPPPLRISPTYVFGDSFPWR